MISELINRGIEHPVQAIESAIAKGMQLGDLQQLLEHFDKHTAILPEGKTIAAWGPKALRSRVKHWRRSLPCHMGWPDDYNQEWKNYLSRKQHADQLATHSANQQIEDQGKALAEQQREERYGSLLDSLSHDDLMRQLQRLNDFVYLKKWFRDDNWRETRRRALLVKFEAGKLTAEREFAK